MARRLAEATLGNKRDVPRDPEDVHDGGGLAAGRPAFDVVGFVAYRDGKAGWGSTRDPVPTSLSSAHSRRALL